jgi:hypothetical protein
MKKMRTKRMPKDVKKIAVYRNFWNRLYRENRNVMLAICGGTGSGKSWAAIRIGWINDRRDDEGRRFDLERIVFTPEDFMALVKKKLPAGSWIVWDEVGVGMNSRQWYSLRNQLISYIAQTFRYKNYGVIFTVPGFNYIDVQVRRLIHAYIEMNKPHPDKGYSTGRFKWVSANAQSGQLYFPNPRYRKAGHKCVMQLMRFGLAPKELLNAYEDKKRTFTEEWYKIYHKQLQLMKETLKGTGSQRTTLRDFYKIAAERIQNYINEKGQVSRPLLMLDDELEGLSDYKAGRLATLLNEAIRSGKLKTGSEEIA